MVSLFVVTLIATLSFAAKFDGDLSTGSDMFEFISKFCAKTVDDISEVAAEFHVSLTYPGTISTGTYTIALYNDTESNSENLPHTKNCWDHAKDKKCGGSGTEWSSYAKKEQQVQWEEKDGKLHYSYTFRVTETQRPHFWYLALVNCDGDDSTKVEYDVHMYQKGSNWDSEFSWEKHGINTLYLIFTFLYLILGGLQIYAIYLWHNQDIVHHIIKIIATTVFLQFFSVFLLMINYGHYASSGKDVTAIIEIARILSIVASTTLLMVLLLMSQGWLISTYSLQYGRTIIFGCLLFCLTQVGFFFWRLKTQSHEDNDYFYNTPPQILFSLGFLVVGCVFVASSYFSWRKEEDEEKSWLYKVIAGVFFLWFAAPILAIIIAVMVSEWVRDIVVTASWETANFLWLGILMFLLFPTRAEKYFEITKGRVGDISVASSSLSYNKMEEDL